MIKRLTSLYSALFQPSSWKVDSANFRFVEFSEVPLSGGVLGTQRAVRLLYPQCEGDAPPQPPRLPSLAD